MIVKFFWALVGSTAVRYAFAALLAWGGYASLKLYWKHEGARVAVEKIEKKANANVKTADAVRDAVASGRRGLRDPNRRATGH